MARKASPLTDTAIASAKPKNKGYYLYDGGGLGIFIRPTGTKSWHFKYQRPNDGKHDTITIGDYVTYFDPKRVIISMKAAREKRAEYLALLTQGIDPKQQAKEAQRRVEAALFENALTTDKVGYEWHAAYAASGKGWKYPDSELARLKNHLFPEQLSLPDGVQIENPLLKLPIRDVKSSHLLMVFEAMDKQGISTTLERIRGFAVKIFDMLFRKII